VVPDVSGRPVPVCPNRSLSISSNSDRVWCTAGVRSWSHFVPDVHCRPASADPGSRSLPTSHLYADDTQSYGFCRPSASLELQNSITNCVDDVARWMRSNRLQLNTAKTEIMWSTTGQRSHQLPQLPLRVGTDEVMPASVVRDLGIYIVSNVSMRSQVTKTVSACFAVMRQLRSVRRSVPRSVLQSLVTLLILTRLDHGNATLAGIPLYLLKWLQSVMNSAARLVCSSSRYEHITPLLRQLHWLKAAERIDKLALLVYKCRQGVAPPYLADELCQPADTEAQCHLCSASTSSLIVRRTRLSTVGDRAVPVAGPRIWNSLPQHVTSAPSLAIFRSRLKTHLLGAAFHDFTVLLSCLRSDMSLRTR